MRNFLLYLIILFPFFAQSQVTFNKQFDAGYPFLAITSVYPTDSCYYASSIYQGPQDGYLVLGNTFFKFDLEGNILIQKSIGSPTKWYQTWRADLIPTSDGGLATLGITSQDGPTRGVILKYNAQGDTIFTKEFLSPFYPSQTFIYAAGIQPNQGQGYWGLTGVNAIPGASNVEPYLIRVDENGNILEEWIYENEATDTPISLSINEDRNITIGSQRSNIGQVNNNFFSRAHIFNVDNNGEIQWEYLSNPGLLVDNPTNLIPTPDGGLIASSGIGTILEVNPSTDYILWSPYFFKLNAGHELEWAREFRGTRPGIFTIREMVAATDGSGYVGISQIGDDVSTGEELQGSWIMKVSPEGDSLWTRYYSVFDSLPSEPEPYDIKNTLDGGYIIVGKTETRLIPDQLPAQRGWILKVDQYGCLIPGCQGDYSSSQEEGIGQLELAIFPNPASDFLNFELRGQPPAAGAVFRVVNATGQVVKQISAGQVWGTGMVPLQGWSKGMYWLQYVEAGRMRVSEGFVVE